MYAVLAAKAAEERKLPVSPIVNRHFSSYLAGAYLGSDVQVMPAAVLKTSGEEVALTDSPDGPQCHPDLSKKAGGFSYAEMVKLADEANFRHALWQIAEAIADLFEQIVQEQPLLQNLPADKGPTWAKLTSKWGGSHILQRASHRASSFERSESILARCDRFQIERVTWWAALAP